jgi:hypothetical protein
MIGLGLVPVEVGNTLGQSPNTRRGRDGRTPCWRGHTPARPNWLNADANKVKQARGLESHLGVELEEAWRGLR